jgi:hypothetical protein
LIFGFSKKVVLVAKAKLNAYRSTGDWLVGCVGELGVWVVGLLMSKFKIIKSKIQNRKLYFIIGLLALWHIGLLEVTSK